MNLQDLTADQLTALKQQLAEEQAADQKRKEDEILTYKNLSDDTILKLIPQLVGFSFKQKDIVELVFDELSTLIKMKAELFKTKEKQDSYTFTARDGSGSITIGWNTVIGFDGTESAGVQMIHEYIANMSADDSKRKVLGDLLQTFMKKDKKGNLNPVRIAELVSKKQEVNDPLFTNGVDTIVNAQFKTRTTTFVRGWQRIVEEGKPETKISFSITV